MAKNLIGNNWCDASDNNVIEIHNPATNELIDTVPVSTEEDCNNAVSEAKKYQKEWAKKPLHERAAILMKFVSIIESHKEELAKLENIKSATYQKLDLASLKDCLVMVEEEVDPTSYMLFQDHLNTLEPLFARDLDPQQLTFASLDTSKHSPSSEIN